MFVQLVAKSYGFLKGGDGDRNEKVQPLLLHIYQSRDDFTTHTT